MCVCVCVCVCSELESSCEWNISPHTEMHRMDGLMDGRGEELFMTDRYTQTPLLFVALICGLLEWRPVRLIYGCLQ